MTKRKMDVGQDIMVDGVDPVPDGTGTPFFAVQMVARSEKNRKYLQVFYQDKAQKLHKSIHDDDMVGAGTIYVRTDGTACVIGGGRDNTIVVSADIPEWMPVVTGAELLAALRKKGLL